MQEIELRGVSGLRSLCVKYDEILRRLPRARGEMYEEIGRAVKAEVRERIGGTGKVQSWQERYVGSKGGYAAVRPKKDTYQSTKKGTRYAVGYVTNAIENGRRTAGGGRVEGKRFYAGASSRAEAIAARSAERFLSELKRWLEG